LNRPLIAQHAPGQPYAGRMFCAELLWRHIDDCSDPYDRPSVGLSHQPNRAMLCCQQLHRAFEDALDQRR